MSWFLTLILDWFWGKIASLVAALAAKKAEEAEIDKEAQDSVVPLENAETADEIDKAADDSLNGF